jgi:hypothetical protein
MEIFFFLDLKQLKPNTNYVMITTILIKIGYEDKKKIDARNYRGKLLILEVFL